MLQQNSFPESLLSLITPKKNEAPNLGELRKILKKGEENRERSLRLQRLCFKANASNWKKYKNFVDVSQSFVIINNNDWFNPQSSKPESEILELITRREKQYQSQRRINPKKVHELMLCGQAIGTIRIHHLPIFI